MQTHLSHIQFNVQAENVPFYRELFDFLGWDLEAGDDSFVGFGGPGGTSIWFIGEANDAANDYDGRGMNHLAVGTAAQGDVDTAAAWLRERGIELLFDTPRHRPEFSGEDSTYYQIMFESPDHILLEVVYTGPKE
ncbi:MAG: hypothetical protein DCC58_20295 [Chloroflexi bacterium]|nr:MAG: hypothetical protein DCC58_20295 [Chloroflexota bacterium]